MTATPPLVGLNRRQRYILLETVSDILFFVYQQDDSDGVMLSAKNKDDVRRL